MLCACGLRAGAAGRARGRLGAVGAAGAAAVAGSWCDGSHVPSVVSGDAVDDIGILSAAAKSRGYNALFLTDHQGAGNLPISTAIANHAEFDNSYGTTWTG